MIILVDVSKLNYFENQFFLFVLKNGVVIWVTYSWCEKYLGFFMNGVNPGEK